MVTGRPKVLWYAMTNRSALALRGGIGAGGVERSLLGKEEVRTVQRQVSVYLVGGYLVIALDPVFLACV